MEKLLYTGKAKQMWQTDDPEVLRVVYMDQATALNGKEKDHFAGKGKAANAISTLVFQYLVRHGIQTHFIKKLSDKEELVKKCQMVPLEFVTRNVIAGHFASRYGLHEGDSLTEPVEETFYKTIHSSTSRRRLRSGLRPTRNSNKCGVFVGKSTPC